MAKKVNWGIIGLGKIAAQFAEDLLYVENAYLYGVASRDKERAESFARKFGAVVHYEGYESLVRDPNIDIVYVATPHVFHFENTMLCLKNNKAVLCEKPMGMNQMEVKAMIEEAKSRNLFLMEALWTRFIPGTIKLMDLVESKVIGDIIEVRADFGFLSDMNPEGRMYSKSLGGGSLMDVGIYTVYLSLLLLGRPYKIEASANFTQTMVDSSCSITLMYSENGIARLSSSICEETPVQSTIYGSNGSIHLPKNFHHTKSISVSILNGNNLEVRTPYLGNGYYYEILSVMQSLSENKIENEKMPHSDSLALITILDNVREVIGLEYSNDERELN